MKHARQRREATRRTDRQKGVIQPEQGSERRNCGTDGASAQPDRQTGGISLIVVSHAEGGPEQQQALRTFSYYSPL